MPPEFAPLRKNRTNDGVFFIHHTPDLEDVLIDLSSKPGWKQICAMLDQKRYTVKDTELTYRIINHWMSEGLLEDDREQTAGWRKLSFKDIIWLRVLQDLRKFGLPLEKLRVSYKTLGPSSLWFEVGLALCLQKRAVPVFVVVLDDGTAEVATLHSLRITDYMVGYDHPYIRVNLNTLCAEFFNSNKLMPPRVPAVELLDQERRIINSVRDQQLSEVKLHLKNGEIERLETTERFTELQNISNLMGDIGYGEITVQVENGKTVSVKKTKKTKTKK